MSSTDRPDNSGKRPDRPKRSFNSSDTPYQKKGEQNRGSKSDGKFSDKLGSKAPDKFVRKPGDKPSDSPRFERESPKPKHRPRFDKGSGIPGSKPDGKLGGDPKFGKDRTNGGRSNRGRSNSDDAFEQREPVIYGDNPKGIAVRRAASDLLALVRDGTSLDDALSECRSYQGLNRNTDGEKDPAITRADKGFARAMATTVLRYRGTIDHLIQPYLDRPLPAKVARVMDCLRLSAAQTIYLDTPPHAAVSLATELCKERRETAGYANLVNAVARKLAATSKEKIAELPMRINTPAWLWRSWERAYGPVTAKQIALAHHRQAPLDITLSSSANRAQLTNDIAEEMQANIFPFNDAVQSLRLGKAPANVTVLPGFEEGNWWVQDLAASLPVNLLGDITGKTVIDLCAAPGGKTLQLASAGAKVTAIDRSEVRLQRLQRNLERTKLHADVICADALDYRAITPADIVLLDAPCSATGTIRRHPDIPWSKSETDIASLVRVQSHLLDHTLSMLKPGGTLLYCTCSLQPDEGEKQIAAALKRHSKLERHAFSPDTDPILNGPWGKALTKDGDIRLLPSMAKDEGGMDGFFISRLSRVNH